MKKIILLLILIVGIGSLMGATHEQTVIITDSTIDQTIAFDYFNASWGTLTNVSVELYTTTANGHHHADNDGDTIANPVTISLGASFNLYDNLTAPRLLNSIAADVWNTLTSDSNTTSLAVENGDGATFDPTAPDGELWFATGANDNVTDNILAGFIGGYIGAGTFSYTLIKTDYININATGGDVDGQYSGSDLGGYVKLIYTYTPEDLPVTLSSFTAMYLTEGAQLQWTTQSESANMGWNIYRSITGSAEEAAQLNVGLIEGAGTVSEPTDYMFVDGDELTTGNTYYYWIEDVTYGNITTLHGPVSVQVTEEGVTPETPEIAQQAQIHNYPNPFNPATSLYFSLKDNEVAQTIEIYNVRGQKVRSFDAPANPQQWDGKDMTGAGVSSGIYMYVLKTNQNNYVKKMVLSK